MVFTFSRGRRSSAGFSPRGAWARAPDPRGMSLWELGRRLLPACRGWVSKPQTPSLGRGTGRPGAPGWAWTPSLIPLWFGTPSPNPRIRPKSPGLSDLQLRNLSPRADRCTAGTGRKATSAYLEGLKDFIPLTQTLPPPTQAVDSLLGTMSDQGLDSTRAGYLRLTTSKIY